MSDAVNSHVLCGNVYASCINFHSFNHASFTQINNAHTFLFFSYCSSVAKQGLVDTFRLSLNYSPCKLKFSSSSSVSLSLSFSLYQCHCEIHAPVGMCGWPAGHGEVK